MSGKNQTLELMKAMAELTEGFREAAPLMADIIEQMMKAVSGESPAGYIEALTKIDKASGDEKEMMLLLMSQWIATVKVAAGRDEGLKNLLTPLFDGSKILGKI